MLCSETALDGVLLLTPQVFGDHRGWFYESYSKRTLEALGIHTEFVQDNRSFSARKGTLRGLHCQKDPMAQAKLVTCTRGRIRDVAVDLRDGSPTYLQWIAVELSAENKQQLFLPRGCLHGFVALTDDVELLYKADNFYSPADDRSIRWNDPAIGVDWGVEDPILSQKDQTAPLLADSDVRFQY